jgi:hypothetical protein
MRKTRNKWPTPVALLLLAFSFSFSTAFHACSTGATKMPDGQETPRDLLRKYHMSVLENDIESFRECYFLDEVGKPSVDAAFHGERKICDFRDKIEDTYGREAVDYFAKQDPQYIRIGLPADCGEWWKTVDISVEGDRAKFSFPGGILPMHIRRDNGAWRMESHVIPGKETIAIEQQEQLNKMLDYGIEKAGPDRTPQELRKEMTQYLRSLSQ